MTDARPFHFKHFSLYHHRSTMKVGTDAILLGRWVEVRPTDVVLDIGTGCGLLPLMLSQKGVAQVDAVDIDKASIEEATVNFETSQWRDQLKAYCMDSADFQPEKKYDLIVSNPPFFTNGVLPPNASRNHARHTTTLSLEALLNRSRHMLAPSGMIAIITPVEVELAVRRCLVALGLGLRRLTRVFPVDGAPAKRLLWELVVGDACTVESTLTIAGPDRAYSDEYKTLTGDFYLD